MGTGTATMCHRQMNCTYMNEFFDALKEEREKNNMVSKSDRIWNMDETWMVLEQKPIKVLALTLCYIFTQ